MTKRTAKEIYEDAAFRLASRYAASLVVGDRVRDRYHGQIGTVLGRTQDCDWSVEWDNGVVTHGDGWDWERLHPLEELAEQATTDEV